MGWNANIDWTSADTIRETWNDYLVLYDLMEAVRERQEVLELSISDPIVRGDRLGRVLDIDEGFEAICPGVGGWLSLFVNQTDNGGNWNDQASIPVWSVADLETYIGSARPEPMMGGRPSAEWAHWMYTALNLLIWTKQQTGPGSGAAVRQKKTYTSGSWATAVSDFNSSSWGSWRNYVGYPMHSAKIWSGQFVIERWGYRNGTLAFYASPPSQSFKADFYINLIGFFGGWEDNDFNVDDGDWVRAYTSDTIWTTTIPAETFSWADIPTASVTEPSGSEKGWRVNKWAHHFQIVRKFDVTGGLDYV